MGSGCNKTGTQSLKSSGGGGFFVIHTNDTAVLWHSDFLETFFFKVRGLEQTGKQLRFLRSKRKSWKCVFRIGLEYLT